MASLRATSGISGISSRCTPSILYCTLVCLFTKRMALSMFSTMFSLKSFLSRMCTFSVPLYSTHTTMAWFIRKSISFAKNSTPVFVSFPSSLIQSRFLSSDILSMDRLMPAMFRKFSKALSSKSFSKTAFSFLSSSKRMRPSFWKKSMISLRVSFWEFAPFLIKKPLEQA